MLTRWVGEFFRERRWIAFAIVGGFLGAIVAYVIYSPAENEVLSVLIGALAGAFAQVVAHYFAEPRGAKMTETLEALRTEHEMKKKDDEAAKKEDDAPPST
jgi:uncharacterized protein YacL